MKKVVFLLSCFILFACNVSSFAQTDSSKYKIVNKFQVEGDGGWDYLTADDSTGRLFISHGKLFRLLMIKQESL